jgi:hypothetical protein
VFCYTGCSTIFVKLFIICSFYKLLFFFNCLLALALLSHNTPLLLECLALLTVTKCSADAVSVPSYTYYHLYMLTLSVISVTEVTFGIYTLYGVIADMNIDMKTD